MRYAILLLIVFIMAIGSPRMVWSQEVATEELAEIVEDEFIDAGDMICPVDGEAVDENVSYVYEGKRYYFCSPECLEEFKAYPGMYVEEMEEVIEEEMEDEVIE